MKRSHFGDICRLVHCVKFLMNDCIPLISIRNFSDKSEGAILREILSKLPDVYVDQIEYTIQKYFESVYISSWHISENENAAMWDRYTHGGEGVAIKTKCRITVRLHTATEYCTRHPERLDYASTT